jgi:MFS family permease
VYSIAYGIGSYIAPIAAGGLYDYGGWSYTTETMAICALILTAASGALTIVGYKCIPAYTRKDTSEPSRVVNPSEP